MVTTRINDEHGGLRTWLILISSIWCDGKFDTFFVEFIFQLMPIIPFHNDSKMHGWHIFPVHRIRRQLWHLRDDMCYNLVTKELEHTRFLFFSTCGTTKHIDIELLCLLQIINWKGEMERTEFLRWGVIGSTTSTNIVFVPIALTNTPRQPITSI